MSAWLYKRHLLRTEAIVVLVFYVVYEAARGLVVGSEALAVQHAHQIVSLERLLHIFVERDIQQALETVPGLIEAFGIAYLTLHLAVTGGYLLWLHQRRHAEFAIVRTTLLIASALALIGYLVFPTAPPRSAGLGVADTVSNHHIDLNTGLISAIYNPYAAVPSMHLGYALVIGVSLLHCGRRRALQILGGMYPAFILLVIVATGNHFFLDAFAGAVTVALGLALARAVHRSSAIADGAHGREKTPLPSAVGAPTPLRLARAAAAGRSGQATGVLRRPPRPTVRD